MNESLRLTLTYVVVVLFVIWWLWVLLPILYGRPWVPTRLARIRKALKLVDLQPGEMLFDLGAGDGRVLIMAAREFGARAVGIEIGPLQCLVTWLRAVFNGLTGQIRIRRKDYYKVDLKEADVVYTYLTSAKAARLAPQLERQLRPGARVVAVSADIPGWQPEKYDDQELIFVYHMPPTPGDLSTLLLGQDLS
jgi:cyclopropane fatty-acyl-phospholipid synthase-like methyltransferase